MTDDDAADGPVLDPEELDIVTDERVEELDEGRFVISAGDGRPTVPDATSDGEPSAARKPSGSDAESGPASESPVDGAAVSRWLAESFTDNGFSHGFDATLKVDGDLSRHRMVSNDVTTTFETLVLWYARQVGGDTPPEEALGLLLAESDLPVRFPARSLHRLLDEYDLGPNDSIADLVFAVESSGGFVVD